MMIESGNRKMVKNKKLFCAFIGLLFITMTGAILFGSGMLGSKASGGGHLILLAKRA